MGLRDALRQSFRSTYRKDMDVNGLIKALYAIAIFFPLVAIYIVYEVVAPANGRIEFTAMYAVFAIVGCLLMCKFLCDTLNGDRVMIAHLGESPSEEK
jgi:hypothetical protein